MSCKSMKQDENDQNYKKESTLVVGKKPYGKSRKNSGQAPPKPHIRKTGSPVSVLYISKIGLLAMH